MGSTATTYIGKVWVPVRSTMLKKSKETEEDAGWLSSGSTGHALWAAG